jgi:hypothetical protein
MSAKTHVCDFDGQELILSIFEDMSKIILLQWYSIPCTKDMSKIILLQWFVYHVQKT